MTLIDEFMKELNDRVHSMRKNGDKRSRDNIRFQEMRKEIEKLLKRVMILEYELQNKG